MDYKRTISNWQQLDNLSLKDLFLAFNRDGVVLSRLPKEELKNAMVTIINSYEPEQRYAVQLYLQFFENMLQTSIDVPFEEEKEEFSQQELEPQEPITATEQEELDEYRKNAKYVEDTEFLSSLGDFKGETNE